MEGEKITVPSHTLHLSMEQLSALNTSQRESCGHLFSPTYRNTRPNAPFNQDMTGALRVSRI